MHKRKIEPKKTKSVFLNMVLILGVVFAFDHSRHTSTLIIKPFMMYSRYIPADVVLHLVDD